MRANQALEGLSIHGITGPIAARTLEIARRMGESAEPVDGGYISITYDKSDGYGVIERISKGKSRTLLAQPPKAGYTEVLSKKKHKLHSKETKMATKRGSTAVAEPETEDGPKDYSVYADKAPTATMTDFADWLIDEVGLEFPSKTAEDAFRTGVRLGGTLRMEFQRSDFNRDRRAERAKEAAATNGKADEPEATPKRSARSPKPAQTTKTTTPRRRGRPAAATAAAATSGEAPY